MPNEEYLFAIDKYGKLRINPKYEINLTDLAALNSILDAISPKSHELDELKEKNASLKIELATERDLLHQTELERRDKELSELKQQIDALNSRTPSLAKSELDVISEVLQNTTDKLNSIYESLFGLLKPNTPSLLDDLTGETKQAVKEALGLSNEPVLPEIAQQFMAVLMQYDYQKSHANMITNHILAVADEKAFMDKSKLAKYLSLFNYIGSANIHQAVLDYWSAKMKLSGDDEAGSGAKK